MNYLRPRPADLRTNAAGFPGEDVMATPKPDAESRESRIKAFFLNRLTAEAEAAKMLRWDPPFDAGSWLTVRKGS